MLLSFTYYIYIILLIANGFLYSKLAVSSSKKDMKFAILAFYLIVMILVDLSSYFVAKYYGNNFFFSHIYYILHGSILTCFAGKTYLAPRQRKIVKYCLLIGFTLILFQYFFHLDLFFKFNFLEVLLVDYLLIVCSLFYFYNTLGNKRLLAFLNFGVLIYSAVDLSILAFGNLLAKFNFETAEYIWIIREIALLFYYTLFLLQWNVLWNGKLNLLRWK